jgi:hypothetical protein
VPSPDKYGNQSSISLLNQLKDYGGFYDLKGLRMKRIDNTLVIAAMNPSSGSFYVQDRMQRHFCTLATPFPSPEVLTNIYSNIMGGHFETFHEEIQAVLPKLISFQVAFHNQVAENICNGVRTDAKQVGYMDAKEQLWEFFINRVRALLHMACTCRPSVTRCATGAASSRRSRPARRATGSSTGPSRRSSPSPSAS